MFLNLFSHSAGQTRKVLLIRKISEYVHNILDVFGLVDLSQGLSFSFSSGDDSAGEKKDVILAPYLEALTSFRTAVRSHAIQGHPPRDILAECDKVVMTNDDSHWYEPSHIPPEASWCLSSAPWCPYHGRWVIPIRTSWSPAGVCVCVLRWQRDGWLWLTVDSISWWKKSKRVNARRRRRRRRSQRNDWRSQDFPSFFSYSFLYFCNLSFLFLISLVPCWRTWTFGRKRVFPLLPCFDPTNTLKSLPPL